jgi:hypothetical protein
MTSPERDLKSSNPAKLLIYFLLHMRRKRQDNSHRKERKGDCIEILPLIQSCERSTYQVDLRAWTNSSKLILSEFQKSSIFAPKAYDNLV